MTFQFTHFDLFGGPMFNNALATITNGYTELTQANFLDPLSIFTFSIIVSLLSVVYIFIKTWNAEDSLKPIIDFDSPWHGNIITKGIVVYVFATLLLTPIPVIQYSPIIAVDSTTASNGTNANKTQLKTWLINDMKTTASPISLIGSVSSMDVGIDDNRRTRVEFVPMILWPIGAFEKLYYGFPDITDTEIEALITTIDDVSTLGSTDPIGYDYFKWDPEASKLSEKTLFGCLANTTTRDFLDWETNPDDYDNKLQARYHFNETDIKDTCLNLGLNDASLAVSIFGISSVSGILQDFFEPIDRFFGLLVNSTASDVIMAKLNSEKTKLRVQIAAQDKNLSTANATTTISVFKEYVEKAIVKNNKAIVKELIKITKKMSLLTNSALDYPRHNNIAALVGLIAQETPPNVWIGNTFITTATGTIINKTNTDAMATRILDAYNNATTVFQKQQIATLCLDQTGAGPTTPSLTDCQNNLLITAQKQVNFPANFQLPPDGVSINGSNLLDAIIAKNSFLANSPVNINQILTANRTPVESVTIDTSNLPKYSTEFSNFTDTKSGEVIKIGGTLNTLYRLDRHLADHQLILSYLTYIAKDMENNNSAKNPAPTASPASNTIIVNDGIASPTTNSTNHFTTGFYKHQATQIPLDEPGSFLEFYINFESLKQRIDFSSNIALTLANPNKPYQKDYLLFKEYVGYGPKGNKKPIYDLTKTDKQYFSEAHTKIQTILSNLQNPSEILKLLPTSASALENIETQMFSLATPSLVTEFNKIDSLPWTVSDKANMRLFFEGITTVSGCPIASPAVAGACTESFVINKLSDYMMYRYSESVSNNKTPVNTTATNSQTFLDYIDAAATLKYYLAESINATSNNAYAMALLDMMVMAKDQVEYPAGYSQTAPNATGILPFTDDYLENILDRSAILAEFKTKFSLTTEQDVLAELKLLNYWVVIDHIMNFRADDMRQEAIASHLQSVSSRTTTPANAISVGSVDSQCYETYSPPGESDSQPVKIDFDGLSSVPILGTLFKAIVQTVWWIFSWIMDVIREFQNTITYSTTDVMSSSSGMYNPTAVLGMYKSSSKGIPCQQTTTTTTTTSSISGSGLFKPSTDAIMRPINSIMDMVGDAQDLVADNKAASAVAATGVTAALGYAAYKKGWQGIKSSIKDFFFAIVMYIFLLTLALMYFFGIIFIQMLKFVIMSAVSVFIGMARAIIVLPLILSLKVLAYDPGQKKTYEHLSWMDSMGFWSNFWASTKQILAPLIVATAGFVLLAVYDYIIYPFALELSMRSFIDSLAGMSVSYVMTSILILGMAFLYYKLIKVVFNYTLGVITSNVAQDPLITGLKDWKDQSSKLSKLK